MKNNDGSRIKRYDVGISIFSRIRAMFRQCQVECWHVIVDMNFLNFLKWKTKSWKTTVWDSNDSNKTGIGFVLSRDLFYLGFFGAAAEFQLRIGFAFRWMLACVAGVRKGRGRELGRETTREGGGRRGRPARKPLFSPSRLLMKKINKNNATVND